MPEMFRRRRARGGKKNSSGLSPSAVVLAAKPGTWTRRGTVLASQGGRERDQDGTRQALIARWLNGAAFS